MFKPDKKLTKQYLKYRQLYWLDHDLELPEHVSVGWNDEMSKETLGITICGRDEINDPFHRISLHPITRSCGRQQVNLTLLHEMAHVGVFPYVLHGKTWINEMRRLAAIGAFDKLW